MEITPQQLDDLNSTEYILYDMRSESARDYGIIDGALPYDRTDALKITEILEKK